jgi:hypothetical protein
VPIKYDLSDLKEKIEWLVNNDAEARKIAENAMEFARTRLQFGVSTWVLDERNQTCSRCLIEETWASVSLAGAPSALAGATSATSTFNRSFSTLLGCLNGFFHFTTLELLEGLEHLLHLLGHLA